MLTPNLLHLQIQEAHSFRWAGTSRQQLQQMLLRFSVTAPIQMACIDSDPHLRNYEEMIRGLEVVTELARTHSDSKQAAQQAHLYSTDFIAFPITCLVLEVQLDI